MTLRVDFTTDLGARVSVEVESADKLLDVQRQYGRLGWTSGEVPTGGYQFPLDNAADFDWALIGARKFTNSEGEEMVMHKGHAYRRRELEAVDSRKLKLPAAIKYSRGAKSTDPEHVKEKADGEFEYVSLAIFRGGKRQEKFAVPSAAPAARPTPPVPAQAQAEALQEEAAPPIGPELGIRLSNAIGDMLRGTRFEQTDQLRIVEKIVGHPVKALAELTAAESKEVHARVKAQTAA